MAKILRKRRPRFEGLEDRRVPATWGIPWADPQHLTVSFVPDGTQVVGKSSQLNHLLDTETGVAAGQQAILKAIQSWAATSNINVGVVADGGQMLGTSGPAQGDARFGDIRVSAVPLPSGVVAITAPYDPATGSVSGDIVLNSSYDFKPGDAGAYDLFTVALHESGHVFGFADSTDPASYMYNVYKGPQADLPAGAVPAIQALYGGARSIDAIAGTAVSHDLLHPVGLASLSAVSPSTTAVGDLATAQASDYFQLQTPSPVDAPLGVDVQVQSSGISLLAPKVTVYDQTGAVVATAAAPGPISGGASVHFAAPLQGQIYKIQVQGATGDVFSVGSYQVTASATGSTTASVSRPTDGARPIDEPAGYAGATPLTASASIGAARQADVYSLKAPASNPDGMTVNVQDWGVGLVAPRVTVYDALGVALASAVAPNASSPAVSVHLATVLPNATYFVRVENGTMGPSTHGTYQVSASFAPASAPQSSTFAQASTWLGSDGGDNAKDNRTLGNAAKLATPRGEADRSHYVAIGAISPSQPQQFYNLQAPDSHGSPQVLTVSVETLGTSTMLPWVTAFDQLGNPLGVQVVTEQNGVAVVQVSLPTPGGQYSIEVSALSGGGSSSNFYLNSTFGSALAMVGPIASGTLAATPAGTAAVAQTSSFSVKDGAIYSMALSGGTANAGTDALLRVTVKDSTGVALTTFTAPAAAAASSIVVLSEGTYTVLIDAYSPSGQPLPKLAYTFAGTNLTDPTRVYASSGTSGTVPS